MSRPASVPCSAIPSPMTRPFSVGILVQDGSYAISRAPHTPTADHVNIQGWEGTKGIAPSQLAGAAPGASTLNSVNAWFIQDYGLYQETTQDFASTAGWPCRGKAGGEIC